MDTLRIMVVDDEPGMRYAVARAMSGFTIHLPDIDGEVAFEVEQAGSGEEALEKLKDHVPDIMLLDHKMGGMSGIDVLNKLREQNLDILTIMITAFATLETAVRATKSGAFDFIAKPFTPEELKETVGKAAGHLVVQRQARKLAAEKRRVRFEFISVLGHELKAPLAAIEGYLNLIRDRALGLQVDSYDTVVERCLARGDGMRKLIADLLDITRIESGEKRREFQDVDVRQVAEAAIETLKPTADAREITITLDAPESIVMKADRGEIEIIFNNLISNAVKYNRDEGAVHVNVSVIDDRITISVRDTGIGLTQEEAAKLFRDFVRIRNEKTRNIEGSGLGLSLLKKLAVVYGGDVHVRSEPGIGSTFAVMLKRDRAATQPIDGGA